MATGSLPKPASGWSLSPEDKPILIAGAFILVILATGTAYTLATQGTASFLSPVYLLQQLQVGAFLGIVAAGAMLVILLGHIDLSIPWTLTAGAMLGSAIGGPYAIPVGLAVGMVVGLMNGLGVAYLRVPSMIFTLGVNAVMRGFMVMLTGGYAPQSTATPLMSYLATGNVLGIPMPLIVWAVLSVLVVLLLQRTAIGRYIYAIGNRERAAYLSGINTRMVIILAFVVSGACSALAGVLLAGYSSKAYQGMGDPYLLPAIAAVVIGGTNILGGRGRYLGTVVGTILIVLLTSVLSVMQMPEAGRQIIYGLVIILMLLVYGRQRGVIA
ncbi:ABC transporter permease [Geminicoccus flavidas]|uniref:ABC transporter permease n=1 Tax=Geminicoccus flavidas TaxID=2506407 RepID=UPI00135A7C3C|nr:ABC transporter permease [Geminicoccus flavidas]